MSANKDNNEKKIINIRTTGHSEEFIKLEGVLFGMDKVSFSNIKIGDADCYLIRARDLVDMAVNISCSATTIVEFNSIAGKLISIVPEHQVREEIPVHG